MKILLKKIKLQIFFFFFTPNKYGQNLAMAFSLQIYIKKIEEKLENKYIYNKKLRNTKKSKY